jgi:hypothetical protein
MSVELSEEIRNAFADPASVKVLASISREGIPHVVPKGSLSVTEDGQIEYLELLESSTTNRNLIYSLWFEKEVAITVVTKERKAYQIKGIPVKTLVSGGEYEKAYIRAQERNKENDLAAVYYIEPVEVVEESYLKRKEEEEKKHPLYIHIDRLAKNVGEV